MFALRFKKKFDYAIMIHGDDQYDVKYIPNIVKKLKEKMFMLLQDQE